MTLTDAKRLLATLAAAFPNYQDRNLAFTARIWQVVLGDLPPKTLNVAITKVLMTQRFFPTVAEIREAAESLSPSAHPTAEDAWSEVNRRLCSSTAPPYSDALIQKAIGKIGWTAISTSENVGVERANFMRVYEMLRKKEQDERNNQLAMKLIESTAGSFLPEPEEQRR